MISIILELTKFRLVMLVLFSTVVGYFLALRTPFQWLPFLHLLFSTALVAAGSLALNQWMERNFDARMKRTAGRPLPSGRMKPRTAILIGSLFSVSGLIYMYFAVNLWSTAIAAATLFSYLLFYTPLKRITSLNTIAGAIPGALPPLIGWTAVRGSLSYEAWLLFTIMFLWQLPHFLAIAWLYREEYKNAGFVMLSMNDPSGKRVGFQAVIASGMLLPVSLLPTIFGMTGLIYFFSAFVLGLLLLVISVLCLMDVHKNARRLFGTSIVYLSVLLLMMVIDRA